MQPGAERPVTVIAHLSGRYRGKIHRLFADRLRIGTDSRAEVRFSEEDLTPGLSSLPDVGPYAVLERRGASYELLAAPEADIWVNGRRVEKRLLESGDVLEIGEGGPVLRFRLYPPGSAGHKSVSQVFADCAECVRHGRGAVDRAGVLLAGPTMELLTRTSPVVRVLVAAVLLSLAGVVGLLWLRGERLERQLEAETRMVHELAELLDRAGREAMARDQVEGLRDELSHNVARIDALEERFGARGRVIALSSRAVVFIQGSWGFTDADGRPLRFRGLGPDGMPLRGPEGPAVTLEGDGPPVELLYTGTAFVVSRDGHLLSNRHVAQPWDYDPSARQLVQGGLVPGIRRFLGYLPGVEEPFEVELVRASDRLDVALLRCRPVDADVAPLELAERAPRPGDEVIVMGYPTGINALLARADPDTLREMREAGPMDFWQLARRLSSAGLIAPLATVGVVGQVSESSVVYDAETTHGGSGGPVLDLDGQVLAVNAAILPEFGGSNLGVPAIHALRLLRESENDSP